MKSEWEEAPNADLPRLDIRWLLQEVVEERISTPDDVVTSTTVLIDDVICLNFVVIAEKYHTICFFFCLGFARKSKRKSCREQVGNDGTNRREIR